MREFVYYQAVKNNYNIKQLCSLLNHDCGLETVLIVYLCFYLLLLEEIYRFVNNLVYSITMHR